MKNKDKPVITTRLQPIIIALIILFPALVAFYIFIFYYLDNYILDTVTSLSDSVKNNFKIIIVVTVGTWAVAFYYVTSFYRIHEPKKTKTLASAEWKSIEQQKKEFEIAQIDTSKELKIGGAPINKLSETEMLYDTAPMHDLTMGITRSGKSRKIVRQLVMLASMANESMIFNDPKKEMYQDFARYLRAKGYDVYCLDFRKPEVSNAWNPLDDINYMIELGNIDDADQYVDDQVTSLVVDNGTTEPIWIEGQKALIKSMILEVTQAPIDKCKKNYYSVVQGISNLGKEIRVDGQNKMLLSVYMEQLDELSPSRISYAPISVSPEKTRGSFLTSALTTLHPFTGQKLMKVLSHSDFNFHDFKNGKKALFVVNPDEKRTYNAITAMVYDNAYQSLIFEANMNSGRSLEKRVHMIFDEFGNMPKINMLDTKLTVSLARNVIYHLYLQDFKQMNEVYGDNVASIIRGNCGLWYFISSADFDTCEEMSKKIGEETIWVRNHGGNYNEHSNTTGGNTGFNQQTKRLIDANELLSSDMRDGHGVILYRLYLGPCRVELPDCSEYRWYKEMEHDETEIENDKLKLSYAIPRFVVINSSVLEKHHVSTNKLISNSDNASRNERTPSLKSNEMYWYWSTRDDLDETIISKIIEFIKEFPKSVGREDIKTYLKSDKFISWINQVDQEKNVTEQDIQKIHETLQMVENKQDNNQFMDLWD